LEVLGLALSEKQIPQIVEDNESGTERIEPLEGTGVRPRQLRDQALILHRWGRLEEALALHKKQEALCLELGNKSGLGYCYWSWGLLARVQSDTKTEKQKLEQALALFTELRMPRERDAIEAELLKLSTP
jgi:hypothetical protein